MESSSSLSSSSLRRIDFSFGTASSTSPTMNEDVSALMQKKQYKVQACSNYVGRPLSRQEAQNKMERSNTFRHAANDFPIDSDDIVSRAVQLDFGIRLRNCLHARDTASSLLAGPRTRKTIKY